MVRKTLHKCHLRKILCRRIGITMTALLALLVSIDFTFDNFLFILFSSGIQTSIKS